MDVSGELVLVRAPATTLAAAAAATHRSISTRHMDGPDGAPPDGARRVSLNAQYVSDGGPPAEPVGAASVGITAGYISASSVSCTWPTTRTNELGARRPVRRLCAVSSGTCRCGAAKGQKRLV